MGALGEEREVNAGRGLREARRRAGLTQAEVARRAGVPQPAVARIERGGAVPRVDTLDRLLGVCGAGLAVEARPGLAVDRAPIRDLLRMSPRGRLWEVRGRGFRPERILRFLSGRRVDFVLVGDLAARLHGAPVEVRAVEIAPSRDGLNPRRVGVAVKALSPRRLRRHPAVPIRTRGRQVLSTDHGPLACLWSGRALPDYPTLRRAASTVDLEEHAVRVASLDDLIRLARGAGRPRDPERVEVLGATREEADRRG
jgi:transcriptional regulator with XRE-family HTH domain